MIKFLTDRTYLQERVNVPIDVHPTVVDCMEFERLANLISPKGDFSWRGCQSCVNYMVKFVFDNQERLTEDEKGVKVVKVARMNFPKDDKEKVVNEPTEEAVAEEPTKAKPSAKK